MNDLFTIGEMSKIAEISPDTLRFYEKNGLFSPYYIDPITRYRYYSKEQLSDILKILEFKNYGFSLDAIKIMLENDITIEDAFIAKLLELNEKKEQLEKTISALKTRMETKKPIVTTLTIDDSEYMTQTLKILLECKGYKVIGSAPDGIIGIEKFKLLHPEFVVLDINMPNLNGFETLKEIKKIEPQAKIFMLTAIHHPEMILNCLLNGACGYVKKPFHVSELISCMAKAIERGWDFNKKTILQLLENDQIKALSGKRLELEQSTIQNLVESCRLDDASDITFDWHEK